MLSADYSALEKSILANIDLLTNLIIKLVHAKYDEQKKYMEEINELLNQTSPLLLQLPDGKPEFLEQMYKQLIFQKIPREELSNNFAGLKDTLEKIFAEPFFQEPEESPIAIRLTPEKEPELEKDTESEKDTETEVSSIKPELLLEKLIKVLYPQTKISRSYYLHNIKLDYYLPEKKIAIHFASLPHRIPIGLKLLSHKTGIKLVEIYPDDFRNLSSLSEKLSGFLR